MLGELAVRIVVARRLFVGYAERTVYPVVTVELPRQSGFGIEEVELLVNGELLQAVIGNAVPLVVLSIHLIRDVAVL